MLNAHTIFPLHFSELQVVSFRIYLLSSCTNQLNGYAECVCVCVWVRAGSISCVFFSQRRRLCVSIFLSFALCFMYTYYTRITHSACVGICCVRAACVSVCSCSYDFFFFGALCLARHFSFYSLLSLSNVFIHLYSFTHTLSLPLSSRLFFRLCLSLSFTAQPICHRCALKIFRELWHFYVYDFCSCCLVRSAFAHHFGVWLVR